jgi:DNA-binding LacI/PurR family transcriptional regulator
MEKTERFKLLQSRAFDTGLPMKDICRLAGVAQSTVSRWKSKPDTMTARPYSRLIAAIENYNIKKDLADK